MKTKDQNEYKIGVNKSDLVLLSILNKAVNDISKDEKNKLLSNWISVKLEKNIDYSFVMKIAVVILIIVLGILYWNL